MASVSRRLPNWSFPKDEAQFVLCTGHDFMPGSFIPYTVNVPLARAVEDDVLLVHTWRAGRSRASTAVPAA